LHIRYGTSRVGNREAVAVNNKVQSMSIGTILPIVVILMLIGVVPTWPHARNWGYRPKWNRRYRRAWLWGIWGMLLSIPIIVIVKVVSQHVEQLHPMAELLGD